MTEKDYVKIKKFKLPNIDYLKVSLKIPIYLLAFIFSNSNSKESIIDSSGILICSPDLIKKLVIKKNKKYLKYLINLIN